jgi:hypothetical protein
MEKFSFRLYREYGALNSPPVFDAVETGLKRLGHRVDSIDGQIPVIWSVLWLGRMEKNKQIYLRSISKKLPVLIIEVGNLHRNITWRMSLNNVNGHGFFGNHVDLDNARHQKLKLKLKEYQKNRKSKILITTQHEQSLQWQGMPRLESWLSDTISQIRNYSNRKIVVRPHPRWNRNLGLNFSKDVEIQNPQKLLGTYDDFDIDYNYHCVINHNSGPTIQAAISGIPIICHHSSLAYHVSNSFMDIEDLKNTERESWFSEICHTEWTIDEISEGIPFVRLLPEIEKFFC